MVEVENQLPMPVMQDYQSKNKPLKKRIIILLIINI
jgi:hypothetical protein